MTKGEYRVGIDFNPSNDDTVGQIKRAAADLIDLIDGIQPPVPGDLAASLGHSLEVASLKEMAQRGIENAAMLAVKAATKPKP